MGWFILTHIFSTIFTFITIGRLSDLEKDLEILVLRQQLSILQRKLNHPIKPNRVEKMALAVLTTKIKRISHQGIDQQTPTPFKIPKKTGSIQRRKVLGGIINNYYRSSDCPVLSTL